MNSYKNNTVVRRFVLLLSCLLGLIAIYLGYTNNQNQQISEVDTFAHIVQASINPERIANLTGTMADISNPDYLRLKQQFTNLNDSNPKSRYIYLMSYDKNRSEDKMYFYLDSQPRRINNLPTNPDDLALPGELYQETTPQLINSYLSGKDIILSQPYTDKWGTFVSVMLPIRDANNQILAFVGVDYQSKEFITSIVTYIVPRIAILIILIFLVQILLSWLIDKNSQDTTRFRMASILQYSSDAIYSLDLDGTILDWNLGAEKLFGYKSKDIIGKNVSIIANTKTVQEQNKNLIAVRGGKSIFIPKTTRYHQDGHPLDVSISLSPIFDQNSVVIGMSAIFRDISQDIETTKKNNQKIKDLEKLNKLLIGREIKMIELKAKLKALQNKQNDTKN